MQAFQADLEMGEGVKASQLTADAIRSSMLRLPACLQRMLTWVTTVPILGQDVKRTSFYQTITAFLSLITGLLGSMIILKENFYLFLPFSLLITVSGMRKLQVVIYHHCSHGSVFHSRLANAILGEMISILLVIKDFRTYKQDHMAHHNSKKLLTTEDETSQDLAEIGLMPGVPKHILWQRLILSFVSPFAQVRSFLNRIRLCFLSLHLIHNLCAIAFWASIISIIYYFKFLSIFIIVWIFPLTFLYHISRILRLLAEHKWPAQEIMRSRGLLFICVTTIAVFNGEALPGKTGRVLYDYYQISLWAVRMIFIHLFARVFVLVGDTPCHDYHHRRPSSREWSSYIDARQKDKMTGCLGYPINYSEVWGLFNAIDNNLQSLSECKI